ncbi:MAG: transposase, partial [Gemmataceae bacterium]
ARLARIEAAKKALEEEAEGGEPEKKAQKSFADHDALPLGGKGGFIYGYNAQAAVDEASQILVAAELHDSAADSQALPEILDKVEDLCGKTPDEVLADAGYMSAANVADVEERGVTPLIAPGKGEQMDGVSLAEQLTPTSIPGDYLCPAGKPVPVKSRRGDGSTELKLPGRFCNNCPLRDTCRLYPKRGKSFKVPAEADRERLARHLRIPRVAGGRFRAKPGADSGATRGLVPV